MAKTIKETLLGTVVHGEQILNKIHVLRTVSPDKIREGNEADARIAPLHPKELKLVVSTVSDTEKGAKIFHLSASNGYLPPFEAGQYLNLFTEIDGVRTSRPYSISSSPKQRAYYEITVAKAANGFVSDYLLNNVQPGDLFTANGPAGAFHYQPVFHGVKMLLLAGGSGITPFMSMVREVSEAALSRDIVLLYGCKTAQSALFHDELTALAASNASFQYHLVVSDDAAWTGEKGFLDAALLQRLVPDYAQRTSYICGPQIMNEFCCEELKKLGVPQKRIRREMFGGAGNVQKEPGWPAQLSGEEVFRLTVGERVLEAHAKEPLLVALERAGVRMNVCCRSGECSLCRVQLVSGKVFLAKGMLLRKADEQYGYIHSCKAYPISDVTIAL